MVFSGYMLLSALLWFKWKGDPKKKGYVHTHYLFTLLYSINWHSNVKEVYSDKKIKMKKKKKRRKEEEEKSKKKIKGAWEGGSRGRGSMYT